MVKFSFRVKDELGLHARPAGLLVKEAAKCSSKVTMKKGGKSGDAKRIFNIMGMGIKYNDEVDYSRRRKGSGRSKDAGSLHTGKYLTGEKP